MIVTDLVQCLAVALIAVVVALGEAQVWQLAVVAAAMGVAQAFYFPAFSAIVPDIVPKDELVPANSLNAASRVVMEDFVGPGLGGILVAGVGAALAFGIDALTFAVSALALVAVRAVPARAATQRRRAIEEVREGLTYVRSQRWLWVTLVAAAGGNFLLAGSISVLLPLRVFQGLGVDASGLGTVFAGFGIGAAIGVLGVGQRGAPRRRILTMLLSWASSGFFLLGFGVAQNVLVAAACAAGLGLALELGNVIWTSLLQDQVPRDILGRVSSLDWFISLGLQPLSLALAAPVATAIGPAAALIGAGAIALFVPLAAAVVPGIHDPDLDPARQDNAR